MTGDSRLESHIIVTSSHQLLASDDGKPFENSGSYR